MIAYILEGVGPQGAASDKRMARLHAAGPWQYQPHQLGCMATWRTNGPVSRSTLGADRKTKDGMIYLSPLELPTPEQLLRPSMVERAELQDVIVSQDTGTTIRIFPAMMSPRQILEDATLGEPSTRYGRAVRALMDRVAADPNLRVSDIAGELTECVRLAIMYSYRVTLELLHDLAWLNEASLMSIWGACLQAPKSKPGADDGK